MTSNEPSRHNMITSDEFKIHWRAPSDRPPIRLRERLVPGSLPEISTQVLPGLPPPLIAPGRGRKKKEECSEVQPELVVHPVNDPGSSSATSRPRRITAAALAQIEYEAIYKKITSGNVDFCVEIKESRIPGAGRGVFAKQCFEPDEFVTEYQGDLIDMKEAVRRSQLYDKDPEKFGSFMQYFISNGKKWCIDGTVDAVGTCGRIINHSKQNANLKRKVDEFDGVLRMYFVAIKRIEPGQELLYDYGETDPATLKNFPWLKN